MTRFEVVQIAPVEAAALRAEVPVADLPVVFGRAFQEVPAAVAAQGLSVTGPPFGFYPRMPDATVAVVAGFPTSGTVAARGDVEPFTLPGGRAVRGTHVGPFDGLEATYRALLAWASAEGLALADHMWESYLTDPSAEPDSAHWRTLLTWPLA